MRFSLSIPVIRDRTAKDPYGATFELARIAEDAGFDTATTGHHHFMPGIMSDPLTFLATLAVRTECLRVGTGIFQLPLHDPLQVAEQVATIDELSGGRVSLGVGLGWWALEYAAFGGSLRERGARMEEALTILKLVWTEENVGYEGRFHSFPPLTVFPRPVQQPHPPLWVAGVADAALDRAARLGDAWVCSPTQSIGRATECLGTYRAACAAHGRTPQWILRRYAWIAPDSAWVRDEVLPDYVRGLVDHWRESGEDEAEKELVRRIDAGEAMPVEEIANDRLLWGSPEQVIEQIRRYRETTGCEHLHAAFGAGLPADASTVSHRGSFDELAEMIRLFGREVIPAFG